MTGQHIGPYRVLREIGRGGMGAVYEAIHTQIQRKVAIKILRSEFAQNQQLVARFVTEARAVNIVNHPSVVQISDCGQLPDGLAYIVMEYLEGESLGSRMKRQGGRLTVPEALRLTRQIAAALAAAHTKGIIHRDLKPDNVMIVPDPEAPGGERAKVLDFGIAKVLASAQGQGGDAIEQSSQTRTGMMVGTPLYMAPEQCRGSGIIGDRADVYSLGVMLYRMLCGRPPFIGDGSGAVMAMHIYEPPPPLRQIEPAIPEDLAGLVHQLLVKDPAQRPSMAVVAEQLEQLKAIHTTGIMSTTDIGLITSQPYLGQPRTPTPVATSAVGPNPLITTLAQSAAQMGPPPPRRGPLIVAATICGSLFVGGGVLAILSMRHPDHHPVTVARPVKWTISSEPPGATVLRALDQSEIGRTPWNTTQPAANGQLILILRRAGYADRVVTLDQSANAFVQETLQPLASSATPPTTPPPPAGDASPPATGPKRGKKGRGPKGAVAADSSPAPDKTQQSPTSSTPPTPPPKPKDETSNGRIQVVD